MNVVLRENLTGVRVIRAFNKEKDEEKRMRKTFEDYAETSVSANLLFAGLESTAFFVINICIVAILWIGGDRIGAGFMEIGDITALTEYSIMILFYISRSFFADSSYMLSFSVLCSCVCSRLISPSVSSWHKQDNTLMHQSPGHIQRRTPYNF